VPLIGTLTGFLSARSWSVVRLWKACQQQPQARLTVIMSTSTKTNARDDSRDGCTTAWSWQSVY